MAQAAAITCRFTFNFCRQNWHACCVWKGTAQMAGRCDRAQTAFMSAHPVLYSIAPFCWIRVFRPTFCLERNSFEVWYVRGLCRPPSSFERCAGSAAGFRRYWNTEILKYWYIYIHIYMDRYHPTPPHMTQPVVGPFPWALVRPFPAELSEACSERRNETCGC